jgi:glycosyltransferase involved in cell wall biosynthesis
MQRLYRKLNFVKNRIKNHFVFDSSVGKGPIYGYNSGLSRQPKSIALISYITDPFYSKDSSLLVNHQNNWEAVEIALILNKLGYIVDIVDYFDSEFNSNTPYNLLFGQNEIFDRYVELLDDTCLKIYYATGAHWSFQNKAEQERIDNLEQRKGVKLKRRVLVTPHKSAELADGLICMGNEFTRSTYLHSNKITYRIDPSSFDFLEWPDGKDFKSAVKRFVWFGGRGSVHKGLDLVLEIFKDLPELELYICGPVMKESDFVEIYKKELFETPNIKFMGWVNIQSKVFEDITKSCGYIIFPSCSEGGGGSVITCMHRGLVPIVTVEASIDTKDFGLTLKDARIETIHEAVVKAANRTGDFLEQCSRRAYNEANSRYTRKAFSRNFEEIMRLMIEKHYKVSI